MADSPYIEIENKMVFVVEDSFLKVTMEGQKTPKKHFFSDTELCRHFILLGKF